MVEFVVSSQTTLVYAIVHLNFGEKDASKLSILA